MAKQTRYSDLPHARFYCAWADLPAWRVLRPEAKALLLEMLVRYRPGQNFLTISDRMAAEWVGCARPTIANAFVDLEERGWIKVQRVGRTDGPKARRASAYSLTQYPDDWGNPATKDFERWLAPPERLKRTPATAKKQASNSKILGQMSEFHRDGYCGSKV